MAGENDRDGTWRPHPRALPGESKEASIFLFREDDENSVLERSF